MLNATRPLTIEMPQFDFVKNGWSTESEDWQHFSKDWHSRTMASVLQEKMIHIQADNADKHFIVLDVYLSLFGRLLKHQRLCPKIGVLVTGQPGINAARHCSVSGDPRERVTVCPMPNIQARERE